MAKLSDLQSKNRSGKTLLSVPEKSNVLPPCLVRDINTDLLIAISNEGRLLVFALSELRARKGQRQ